jgi:hypothetical protein
MNRYVAMTKDLSSHVAMLSLSGKVQSGGLSC